MSSNAIFARSSQTTTARFALATLAALLLVAASARDGHAACNTAICSGGATACTITGNNVIDDDCVLNWSGKDVTLASGATLRTASDGQNFELITDDLDVYGTIQDRGASSATPLLINASGHFHVHSTGKIDASRGGTVWISAAGYAQFDGTEIDADGHSTSPDGGWISIESTGSSVSTSGTLHANGAAGGLGGRIDLNSATTLTTAATISTNGSSGAAGGHDGGEIYLTSLGDMTLGGDLLANGNGPSAYGGWIGLTSDGSFVTTHRVHANGDDDGLGGEITLLAADEAEFGDTVRANGGTGGGDGNKIEIDAASVLVSSDWSANGSTGAYGGSVAIVAQVGDIELQGTSFITADAGNAGAAGTIDLAAVGDVTLNGELIATATGGGTGGVITVAAENDVTVAADIQVNAAGTDSTAGSIDISAEYGVTISQTLDARSTSSAGWSDGTIAVAGCDVAVTSTGMMRTRNTNVGGGLNLLTYRGTLGIAGSILADGPAAASCSTPTSGNVFYCRCVDTSPADGNCDMPIACVSNPSTGGSTMTPAPLICPIPMPPC